MIDISSRDNSKIKFLKKIKRKKYRTEYQQYLIEGLKLVQEAIDSNENLKSVFISSEKYGSFKSLIKSLEIMNVPVYRVDDSVFKDISSMENTEGVLAVNAYGEDRKLDDSNVVLMDRLQDPGNLGTIIRTADAAGFANILLSKGCVDVYNEKTVRATMGSLFHVNLKRDLDLIEEISSLKARGYTVVGTDLNSDIPHTALRGGSKYALVIGNESSGISKNILSICDINVKIPIYGRAESLNASVAAGIVMYHIAVQ